MSVCVKLKTKGFARARGVQNGVWGVLATTYGV